MTKTELRAQRGRERDEVLGRVIAGGLREDAASRQLNISLAQLRRLVVIRRRKLDKTPPRRAPKARPDPTQGNIPHAEPGPSSTDETPHARAMRAAFGDDATAGDEAKKGGSTSSDSPPPTAEELVAFAEVVVVQAVASYAATRGVPALAPEMETLAFTARERASLALWAPYAAARVPDLAAQVPELGAWAFLAVLGLSAWGRVRSVNAWAEAKEREERWERARAKRPESGGTSESPAAARQPSPSATSPS